MAVMDATDESLRISALTEKKQATICLGYHDPQDQSLSGQGLAM